jgi:hypothetical protein
MEKELKILANRDDSTRSLYSKLSTSTLFAGVLILDIIFYLKDKANWQLVLLIISAVLLGLELLTLAFAWSNLKYEKKIRDTALISYDGEEKKFIVTDCLFRKELEIDKDNVIEVKTSDKGETYLWYFKDAKKTSTFIGYSNRNSQDLINNEIQKYKNLYC